MDFNELAHRLSTIVAIHITPFDEQLRVDLDALARNLDFLADASMQVVTTCGNTGEFNSLTLDECKRITAVACQRLVPRNIAVVAGVGYDAQTAVQMARHAADSGAVAVMVHHPPHPFVTGLGYVQYVRTIAEAAESIGVIPYVRSANVAEDSLLELVRGVPNIVAVKYAVNDLQRFGSLVAQSPRDKSVAWICGTAEGWAPMFWSVGAVGFTSGLVNVAPRLSVEMLAALREGKQSKVQSLWNLLKPFEDLRARNNSEFNVTVVKEAMAQLKLSSRTVRPPISELPEPMRPTIGRLLDKWKEKGYL
ncbi:MAG TPA: dihydrodipicolinate synthase family protein [Tepidisphaeraceae bacterium]|nr:dihydrodipicolinate synthase family protein [Tepidisphaeraceae bacterium]